MVVTFLSRKDARLNTVSQVKRNITVSMLRYKGQIDSDLDQGSG